MRKGSNKSLLAALYESNSEVQSGHWDRERSWTEIHWPSFTVELCFKFKCGGSRCRHPINTVWKRLLALIRPTFHSCGNGQFYYGSPLPFKKSNIISKRMSCTFTPQVKCSPFPPSILLLSSFSLAYFYSRINFTRQGGIRMDFPHTYLTILLKFPFTVPM